MSNKLNELIASKKLTPKIKIIANYVAENLQECCFIASTELADRLSVSYSSVIRLTKILGFSGYPEFQNFLRECYFHQNPQIDSDILIPAERLNEISRQQHSSSVIDTVSKNVLQNIFRTISANTEEQYRQACDIILGSDLKYIISSRGGNCIAEFLNVIMRQIIPHVYNYGNHGQNIFDFTSDIGKGDCVIAISYPRYSKLTTLAVEMAHKQGARIILITDKITADPAPYADIILTAKSDSNNFYNSFVAAMFTAELLCAYLCRITDYSNGELLKRIDEYTSQIGNY